ncbi:G1/S-specific cyclin pas1 [Choanephora cucurbitarum]|uniref:G1/S-specific cyclin pas1 n=1 Tax=Choanephora cucurbitarum TaxID=101091 RepID=A0A1C7N842_9FUNG|nr:G1/S-specific cyclin pas1 [Choanephora cucurbitarum]
MMIDRLIDMSAEIIDSIWLNKQKPTKNPILPTKVFIREILQRSRATYSMLQLALFYIFRIKKLVSSSTHCLVSCSRRMFLAALILASKYLHDRNYRTQTWAKIASLSVAEITASELVFLKLIDYRLYVSKPLYDKWVSLLYQHIQKQDSIQQHKDNNFASTTQVKSAVPFICPLTKAGDDDHSNNGDDDSCSEISLPNGVCSSSSSSAAASPLNTPPLLPNNTIKKRQLEEQEDWPASKHICLEK